MSVRALKKSNKLISTKPYNSDKQRQYTPVFKGKVADRKRSSEEFNQPIRNRRSKSFPNIDRNPNQIQSDGATTTIFSKSETDLTAIDSSATSTGNQLINSKSEHCLTSISTHTTRPIGENGQFHQIDTGMSTNTTTTSSSLSEFHNRGFADTTTIRIPIVGYEVMEERARFTVFKLRVENPITNDCWLVLRRYTDFVRLQTKLRTHFPMYNLDLPRKKLFGDNFSSSFLDNRVQGLQLFVNSIMSNEILKNFRPVRDFFCLDEPPMYSESMEECRAIFEAQEETISHLKIQLQIRDETILLLEKKLAAACQIDGINNNLNIKK